MAILESSRSQRVSDIKHHFLTKSPAKIHEFIRISRETLDQLQNSGVEHIAAEQKKLQIERASLPGFAKSGESSGIRELLKQSNFRIDAILCNAREKLMMEQAVENDDSSDDAGIELMSVIFATLQDCARARKSNNAYLSRLMGHTRQQLNQL
jgi:hypothetical protein